MIRKDRILVFLAIISVLLPVRQASQSSTKCNRTCGNGTTANVQYPFGFSSGCQIPLNCSPNGDITVGEFPVRSINSDGMLINFEEKCNRSIYTIKPLFNQNYSPTSRNVFLLQNCALPVASCTIPSTMFQTRFENPECDDSKSDYNISCYSEANKSFIDYTNLTQTRCKYLLSSMSVGWLDIQVLQLGWWLEGTCWELKCSVDANCTEFESPFNGRQGFRCQCNEGFVGDGYRDGLGCRKAISGKKTNLITKIGIGSGIVGTILIFISIYCFGRNTSTYSMFYWKGKTNNDEKVEAFIRQCGSLGPKRYTYLEVKKITNSFKDKLGQGGFGDVYKGKLPDGRLVAAKVLNTSKGNGEDFINEVTSISQTSHINVVALLGFCLEGHKRALIYEFMLNGSLEKFIYNSDNPLKIGDDRQLGYEMLHKIAVGIAQGLDYLHQKCNTRILHFDIKPHNILLDQDFCPKISDFGLAKLCPTKESKVSMLEARGTIGYIAPEVFNRNSGRVSYKSDVYSYGMMVLEMVGGRKNLNIKEGDRTSEIYFPHWVYNHLDDDLRLRGVMMSEEENKIVRKMVLVGLWCIQEDPSNRPSMSEVINMLGASIDSLQIPPKPF